MAIDITQLPDFVKVEQNFSRTVATLDDVEYNFDQELFSRRVRDQSTVVYQINLLMPFSAKTAFYVWLKELEAAGFPPFTIALQTEGGILDHQGTFDVKPRNPRAVLGGYWSYSCTIYASRVETGYEDATDDEKDFIFNLGDQAEWLEKAVNYSWPDEGP